MKVNGSEENTLFYDDMKYLGKMRSTSDSLGKLYKAATGKDKDRYKEELGGLDKEVKAQRNHEISGQAPRFILCQVVAFYEGYRST